jgi:predicted GNAT family acetyltransferase
MEAIDDGGIKLVTPRGAVQVAILECKRSFQEIVEGRPTVSDELLGQIVGEELALRLSNATRISKNKSVISSCQPPLIS